MTDSQATVRLRQRTPWLGLTGIGFVVLLTLGNAAANLLPFHLPTAHELQEDEQRTLMEARRATIATLMAAGDQCRPAIARALARALVYDGRSARAYAADHARRCGADPIVQQWAAAPIPRRHHPR